MKALIIENKKLVAQELITTLTDIDSTIKINDTAGSVKTALRWFVENAEPDLIFAAIQLADGVSFTFFKKFHLSSPVIFTTAFNEYAIKAFRINGIDYLLKSVDEAELRQAIAKVRALTKQTGKVSVDIQQLIATLNLPITRKVAYEEHFLGNARNGWVLVNTADMACFRWDQLNFRVTKTSERYILDKDWLILQYN